MGVNAAIPSRFKRLVSQMVFAEAAMMVRFSTTAVLGALVALALPYGSRIALDTALPDASPSLLMVVVAVGVVVVAHQAWFSWIQESTRIVLAGTIEKKALMHVLKALVRSDLQNLQKRDSGWMSTTLNGASSTVSTYVQSYATLLTKGLFALGYLAVLADASPQMTALLVAFNLLVTVVAYLLARLESSNVRELLDRRGVQQELLSVLLTALPSIRGHFATRRLSAQWSDRVTETGHSSLRVARVSAIMTMVKATGNQAFGVGFMIWAAYSCFHGELTIGEMVFLQSVSGGLTSSLVALIGVWTGFRALEPHFRRVDEVLHGGSATMPAAPKVTASGDAIQVENLSFRYGDNERWILRGQTMAFAKGQVHRLSSPSGSGKSTLLRILAGLHMPTTGKVRIFGVDACRAQSLVLYVPQHCRLFETSIRENLELLSGASLERLVEVANWTGFVRVLQALPMGLETLVSAGGQNLSSGQRQLLILTAAFATEKPVILLDESTSQVDAAARRHCSWDKLLSDRTVIVVEHG